VSDTELKSCPFCGGDAELDTMQGFRALVNGNMEDRTVVYCTSCNADMGMCHSDNRELTPRQLTEVVIEAWNTRTESKL